MLNNIQSIQIKKDILVRIVKAFFSEDFENGVKKIHVEMRPKHFEVPYRCCIHKERAIIKDRIIADLGFAIEDDDEITSIKEYAEQALLRQTPDKNVLTVLEDACQGCVPSKIYVTDLCRGCVARPCEKSCHFGAITVTEGKSHIDGTKCKGCKMCISACPYNAIVKLAVPCEDACPVDAIIKNEQGQAVINHDECISCGKCVASCPFGAIHEKSQIIDVLKHVKSNDTKVIAMFAPAIAGQFTGNLGQLKSAIIKAGFSDVFEVALGADITTKEEAKEFEERMENNEPFMTTSCCAGYNELIKKHLSEIKPFVSSAKTPLYHTAKIVREKYKDAKLVFISPCVAKRKEVQDNDNIDYILNAEELEAIFTGRDIEISNCAPYKDENFPSKQGRNFAITGGVAGAVKHLVKDKDKINPFIINGLDKENIRNLKKFAKTSSCPNGNIIEVMACKGGCLGGNATVNPIRSAKKLIDDIVQDSKNL